MTLFRDYLRNHAKFYCPPVDSHLMESASLTDAELEQVFSLWKSDDTVIEARRDMQLVDVLISVLDEALGEEPMPKHITGEFKRHYKAEMDADRDIVSEADVRTFIDKGPAQFLARIMLSCGNRIAIKTETAAPGGRCTVDYVLSTTEGKKALLELKAPSVFDLSEKELSILSDAEDGPHVRLDLQKPGIGMKAVIKMCVCMILYRVEWLALSCFTKWVFLRLHRRGTDEAPYMTYSTIERQLDNTRPFRALLGMMLAISRNIDVPTNADMNVRLQSVPATEAPTPREHPNLFLRNPVQVTRGEQLVARSSGGCSNSSPSSSGFLITWSPKSMSNGRWLEFHGVDTDAFPALGNDGVRLCVQRNIGDGSTGVVFEAIPDDNEHNGASGRRRYAIKTVGKGETLKEQSCARRLFNELDIYRRIEQTSPASVKIVPQCYGLFETSRTWALVMDYEGSALRHNGEWSDLSPTDRQELFNAISTLHGLGVYHDDLEPRNVVRGSDGSLRIIDFTSSTLHDCHPETCAELGEIRSLFGLQLCSELPRDRSGHQCCPPRWKRPSDGALLPQTLASRPPPHSQSLHTSHQAPKSPHIKRLYRLPALFRHLPRLLRSPE
ncbi:uncharacterized protein FOMMEDRAFT_16742 [Fomitiporia mediterranea MF3/22]|uniref:uncharacterized protein n=1 Tax=Fomitiporia mediterranea (strain MF3/22) TaxID=694068 RepID=UPI0004409BDF|nr:uncharacterized protein FOMMEDRAFT_16742 [Fomitiporia mediterranea MF3/22]EJD08334.1 hypothetical protein FOMMEDRAFT_16742 [Fomitiporia mediterranea MF3/22]